MHDDVDISEQPGGARVVDGALEHLDLPYDFESMAAAGSMLGSGSIIVVDDSVPILSVAMWVARFYRHESCGKCVPCREGTNWTVKILERMDRGEATPMDLDVIESVQQNIIGHCLCLLGDSMAMPISAMVKRFRSEFEEHLTARASDGTSLREPAEPDLVGAAVGGSEVEAHPQAARAEDRQVDGHGGSA